MRIQIASDLHLEFLRGRWPGQRLIVPNPLADVLILAGDICNDCEAFDAFEQWTISNPAPILYVAGNHEFYGHDIEQVTHSLRSFGSRGAMQFLENDFRVIDGVRFLGATLWTDYRLVPGQLQNQAMEQAERDLNDHRLIRSGESAFTATHALKRHEESRNWLCEQLSLPFYGKTVVITHHAPHRNSVAPRFKGSSLNPAFVSDLSELMPQVDLWIHGHVHDSVDFQVGRCRVVANPAGYISNLRFANSPNEFEFENQRFSPNLIIEV